MAPGGQFLLQGPFRVALFGCHLACLWCFGGSVGFRGTPSASSDHERVPLLLSHHSRVLPFSLPLPVQSPCTESFIEVGGSGRNHLARSSCCFDTTAAGWTAFARFEIGLSTQSLSVHWTRGVSSGVPTAEHSVDSRPSSSSRRKQCIVC